MQEILEWTASLMGMAAALMVASNYSTRVSGWGFMLFLIGSFLWIYAGLSMGDNALAAENLVLLFINALGVHRYLIRQTPERG